MIYISRVIFEEMFTFFLTWTTLNFEVKSKTKKQAGDIYKGTLDIECERTWSISIGATLGDQQKIKNYFSSFRDFFGESRNPENLIKIVGAIYEKIKFFNFFLMWTTLNFRGRGKTKSGSWYFHVDSRYRIWMNSVNWFRLYVRRRSQREF